jgi:hypothetical protein
MKQSKKSIANNKLLVGMQNGGDEMYIRQLA